MYHGTLPEIKPIKIAAHPCTTPIQFKIVSELQLEIYLIDKLIKDIITWINIVRHFIFYDDTFFIFDVTTMRSKSM